ncbi:MAG: NlpC/P60 family protein [Pseudomonadota bacterium]
MSGSLDDQVVAEARRWLGTPYHHQMAAKGAGCDCLGLIRGVYRAIIGVEPETPPPYSPDWGETDPAERLLSAADRHLVRCEDQAFLPGRVVVLRWRQGLSAKHAGILSDANTLIHAYDRVGVVEVAFADAWKRRVAGVFRFSKAD